MISLLMSKQNGKRIIGAVAGDIIGSPFERHNYLRKDFELFTKFSHFTDDTVLTLATAYALKHGRDYAAAYKLFYSKYPRRGYGGQFMQWAAGHISSPVSQGNGAAMRVSPIGWAFNTLEETLEEARRSAVVSHNSEQAIESAQAVAEVIFLGRHGSSKEEIKNAVKKRYDLSSIEQLRGTLKGCMAQDTVPAALQAFLEAESFEDAIRNAVSIGGDSDTIASIAGAVAESIYDVPSDIRKEVENRIEKKSVKKMLSFREKRKLVMETKKTSSASMCLQSARMLVPKFSFQHEGYWHIHWPKDLPHVVHAQTQKDLVVKLATWLLEIDRVVNKGEHVKPEYP